MRAAGRDISQSVAPSMTSGKPSQSAQMGVHRGHSRVLSVASRAGVSLRARYKCSLGQLGPASDETGPRKRQGRRGGELGSRFVGNWTCRNEVPKSVVCGDCSKPRERRLHIMTAPMRLVHEGCGAGHFTVGGAEYDLRKALAIASDGVHRGQSRALSVASRAGVSLKTQDKCGLGQLRLATDGPGPGERQRRRARELRGWGVRV